MARIRGRGGYKPQLYNKTEVFEWLKTLPLAPEFYPTLKEFQDPISYIQKIEEQASLFGICKIIPPVSLPSRKNTILELNKSFLTCSASPEGKLKPTFTTRVQKVGSCTRKNHLVIKSVRESGKTYTLSEFEAKAKSFEKKYFKKCSIDKDVLSPMEIESIYWNANADKPIDVEYANDMLGSAFVELDQRRGREGLTENLNVGDSEWNLRGAARSEGCPLKFVKDDIPGVTSPMIYLGMMFSWFAWHVEDHDLHSLNYMHMGDGKTWYGVPKDAAIAFEEVIRNHGYGGQMDPILTYATLAKKTTVMSPEVILNAGIPCCRLVQNAGEFVVTFPRAYHSGFSHGFNCAEASNIATPEWLRYAREAAIRRAASNYPPLVSHIQLLYDHALSFSSRVSMSIEPRSSRLEEKKKCEGECLVKELFVKDLMHNTDLLHSLGRGSPAILLPRDFIENQTDTTLYPCVACGVLCFSCAAIIKPSEVAANWWTRSSRGANNAALDSGLGRMAARSCIRPPEDTSSLDLIALAYGDSTDSETESREASPVYGLDSDDSRSSHSTSFPVVPPTESTNSQSSGGSSIPGMVFPNVPVQNRDNLFAPNSDEDSSRSHVFCLQHAFEVEQKLCAFGGVHMLLLCHPDYNKFLAEAKGMANEMGADHIWSDIFFRPATEEDEEIIESAPNSQGSIHGNADWAAKLGVNLFYSANLSHSPLCSNQIPKNPVIYNAFGIG